MQPCLPFLTCIHRWVTLSTGLLKSSSAEVTFWWAFLWDTNIFMIFAQSETNMDIPLFPIHYHFSNHIPCNSLIIQPIHWPQSISSYTITYLIIFPSKQNKQPGALLEVLPLGVFPFIIVLQGHLRKGLYCCSCPLLDNTCTSHRTICKLGLRFLSLSQLIIGTPSEDIEMWWERESNVARMETMGIWATSCNNMPSGPVNATSL